MNNDIKNLKYNPLLKELLQIYCSRAYEVSRDELSDDLLLSEYQNMVSEGRVNVLFECEWYESEERLTNVFYNY